MATTAAGHALRGCPRRSSESIPRAVRRGDARSGLQRRTDPAHDHTLAPGRRLLRHGLPPRRRQDRYRFCLTSSRPRPFLSLARFWTSFNLPLAAAGCSSRAARVRHDKPQPTGIPGLLLLQRRDAGRPLSQRADRCHRRKNPGLTSSSIEDRSGILLSRVRGLPWNTPLSPQKLYRIVASITRGLNGVCATMN